MTRLRLDFAVTHDDRTPLGATSEDREGHRDRHGVLFGVALIATCFLWMDPIGLARAGFDARKLAAETFNFL